LTDKKISVSTLVVCKGNLYNDVNANELKIISSNTGNSMSSKFSRYALLAASLVATAIGFAPAAFAGAGGIAGSASFSGDGAGGVRGAATAAAIGQNGQGERI
jgi:hypothetical protein